LEKKLQGNENIVLLSTFRESAIADTEPFIDIYEGDPRFIKNLYKRSGNI